MIETLSGIFTSIVTIGLSQVLSRYFSIKLIATAILVAIAFIYVGFSLKGNTVSLIIVEVAGALILFFLAIVGFTKNNLLLAYGIILHGLWDIFHHKGLFIATDIPSYWPLFCFMTDIITGLYFLMIFKRQKSIA